MMMIILIITIIIITIIIIIIITLEKIVITWCKTLFSLGKLNQLNIDLEGYLKDTILHLSSFNLVVCCL